MTQVVLCDPSSKPELRQGGAALAAAGMLSRFHVPIAVSPRHEQLIERIPPILSRPLLREARRRALPEGISPASVALTATGSDLVRVTLQRLPIPESRRVRMTLRHRRRFDASVAAALSAQDELVLTASMSAMKTAARASALGLRSVLDCPTGHLRQVRDTMREEARLQPQWAPTMHHCDVPDALVEAHEQELAGADVVLTPSTYARRTLIEQGVPGSRLVTAPLGVDLRLFTPVERGEDGTFRVMFAGRLSQEKGLSYLIDGFMRAALPNSELLLVGPLVGGARPWPPSERIRHLPAVPRSELPALHSRADVFALPSLSEGFGLTAAEAMASGRPAIVSTNTFAADVIHDGTDGYVVPIRDADAISERLIALAGDDGRRRAMGEAARTRIEEWSWARYGEQIVSLMRDLGSADR